MIRALLAAISFFYLVPHCSGQVKDCNKVNKTYPNITNKGFIQNYPDIDQIEIEFDKEKPVALSIFFKPNSVNATQAKNHKERYDWEFDGDIYLFKKKYKKADIPVLPKAEIDYMASLKKCSINYYLHAVVGKDSVEYKFSQCCPSDKKDDVYIARYKPAANYKGDIRQLTMALEKKFDKKKQRPSGDSVLIFKAFVDQKPQNKLQDIELIAGTKSAFSDFIRQGLEESGTSWIPMIQGGRQVKSYIRVYARLNSDGSITMSTSNFMH